MLRTATRRGAAAAARRARRARQETSYRTHLCGHAVSAGRGGGEGREVTVCGHLKSKRAIGGVTFGVLRDWSGEVQFVASREGAAGGADEYERLARAPVESVVQVRGRVRRRPEDMVRPEQGEAGALEVDADAGAVAVLNASAAVPMHVDGGANEETRLRYRYLDLRRPTMQRRLRLRAQMAAAVRGHLAGRGFVEVETPTLFRSTPEGAREFLVPTRQAGHYYALPQSPQQFKQMLMAAGTDRYFQLARCYRDEGMRGDRQPEFTQIDIEASYVSRDDMMREVEDLAAALCDPAAYPGGGPALPLPEVGHGTLPRPPRVPFAEVMARYGSDKPDVRHGLEMRGVADLAATPEAAAAAGSAFCAPGLSGALSRKQLDALAASAPRGVSLLRVGAGAALRGPRRLLEALNGEGLAARLGAAEGDLVAVGASPEALGALRLRCAALLAEHGLREAPADLRFLWVTDFPLFERRPDGGLTSTHHPFTAPHADDEARLLALLEELGPAPAGLPADHEVFSVRAQHYDLVCNGVELGGGSVRIHSERTQKAVLAAVGAELSSFEHLLEVLRHGCPPHAGLAIGFDRLVAMFCDVPSLRDVIAFPKTAQGNDLMSHAPSPVSNDALAADGHLFRGVPPPEAAEPEAPRQ